MGLPFYSMHCPSSPAKLTDMGTYGPGDEDEDVTFDDLVDDYDDEDEAIDAVSQTMDDVVNWLTPF